MKTDIPVPDNVKEQVRWMIKKARMRRLFSMKSNTDIRERAKYGLDVCSAYYIYTTKGLIVPTRHPRLLKLVYGTALTLSKAAQTWARDIAYGTCTFEDFIKYVKANEWPSWLEVDVHRYRREIMQDV